MGDIFWGAINDDKQEIIDNLQEFCKTFNLGCPKLSTKMRLDVLLNISKETRENFWSCIKKS